MTKEQIMVELFEFSAPTYYKWTKKEKKRFLVKTPATEVPGSRTKTVTSLRLALRTPASTTPMRTPGTGKRSVDTVAERLTGMEHFQFKGEENRNQDSSNGLSRRQGDQASLP